MTGRRTILALHLAGTVPATAMAQSPVRYKNPPCQCCDAYVEVLRRSDIPVGIGPAAADGNKRGHGVPAALRGCHTLLMDGYAVEGHGPMAQVERLLAGRPTISDSLLPSMPAASSGWDGERTELFTVHQFGNSDPKVFARE